MALMCKHCEPLIKAIDAYIAKANDDLIEALRAAGFIKPEDTVKDIEVLEEKITQALKDEVEYYRKSASRADDLATLKRIWSEITEDDISDEALEKLFAEDFGKSISKLANEYIKQVDPRLTISTYTARTIAWSTTWSKKLAELMKLETQTEIEQLLTKTLAEGKSVADFTQELMDGGIRSERYRARSTAITEMLRAHSVAQQESIMQNPAVKQKEWVHTGAYRNTPRENHVAMDGVIVPKGEPFTLLGADGIIYHPMYPRDPSLPPGESINCHCFHRGIVDEEVLGMSREELKRLQQEAIDEDDGEWERELDARNKAKAGIEEE